MHCGRSYKAVRFSQGSRRRERSPDFRNLLGNREDVILEVSLDPPQPAFEVCRERRIGWPLQFDPAANLTNNQDAGEEFRILNGSIPRLDLRVSQAAFVQFRQYICVQTLIKGPVRQCVSTA